MSREESELLELIRYGGVQGQMASLIWSRWYGDYWREMMDKDGVLRWPKGPIWLRPDPRKRTRSGG